MALEYRKFYLSPGQQAPNGSTCRALSDGGIVWVGEEGTYDSEIESFLLTQEEIFEYSELLNERRTTMPVPLTKLQFLQRFTFDELVAIETASETTAGLRVLQRQQTAAEYIDVLDPNTIGGVQYLVSLGLLTAERAGVILTL